MEGREEKGGGQRGEGGNMNLFKKKQQCTKNRETYIKVLPHM